MRFLEKTKIQHFLLTSFQHLNDLYPCSRMANNLNFGNCYGLTFPISRNQKSCAFVMAPACNVCFTFETHSVVWLNCIALSSYRATPLRHLFAAVLVQVFRILFVITANSAVKKFFTFCFVTGASVNISGIVEFFQHTIVSASFLVMSKLATTCRVIISHCIRIVVVGFLKLKRNAFFLCHRTISDGHKFFTVCGVQCIYYLPCRWSSRLRLINRAYGLPRKPRL